jgi:hypothetical protein
MTARPDSLERLLRRAENLQPTGTIGDGMVAEFRDLAVRTRREMGREAPPARAGDVAVWKAPAPLVLIARQIVCDAMHDRDKGPGSFCEFVEAGLRDDCPEMRIALAALERGRVLQ